MMNYSMRVKILVAAGLIISGVFFLSILSLSNSTERRAPDHGPEEMESQIAQYLPKTDISGPFTIEYIERRGRDDVIKISDSSPAGREAALSWLRANNINVGDVIIEYEGFQSSLKLKEQVGE